jgi:phage terminase large subunit
MEESLQFQDTLATRKIFNLQKRIRGVCGGTSASKTISIIIWLIDYCQVNTNKKVDVISESIPHLDDGAIKDFKSIMIDRGCWQDEKWNSTLRIYDFGAGTLLKFKSVDKLGKSRGPRRNVLFVNECNNISFDIVDQLIVRTDEVIWLDWNPTNEFWWYTDLAPKRDHDFLTLTYKDCVSIETGQTVLHPAIVEDIESHKTNKAWWRVYGLGQLGEVENRVYTGWQIIDEIPHEARLERYGLDFGYTNDPTAIVAIYYYNGGYILDEIICRTGMLNREIADTMKNLPKALIVADSAEPKSIAEIKGYGLNIIGAKKQKEQLGGIESYVKWSIGQVQQQKVSITKQSTNIIRAYRNYLWKTDKEGVILNVPDHYLSDCMDAVRYGITSLAPILQRADYINSLPLLIQSNEEPENPAR